MRSQNDSLIYAQFQASDLIRELPVCAERLWLVRTFSLCLDQIGC